MSDTATPPGLSEVEERTWKELETIAQKTLRGDVRDILLAYQRNLHNPLPWNMQGEDAQRAAINRADDFATELVGKVVDLVVSMGRLAIPGKLKQAILKDGIMLAITVDGHVDGRHDLLDAVGTSCHIVLPKYQGILGQRGDVAVRADQGGLFDGVDPEEAEPTAESKDDPPGDPPADSEDDPPGDPPADPPGGRQ